MKKIYLMLGLLALSTASFAQEKVVENTKKLDYTISGGILAGMSGDLGLQFEAHGAHKTLFFDTKSNVSNIIRLDFSQITVSNGIMDVTGKGYVLSIGTRTYLSKNKETSKGLYTQNFFTGGTIKFDNDAYQGDFQYFSFFSPEIGYKLKVGNFSIDPSFGWQWNIEIKGRGDVDNRTFDNTFFKGALKLGYSF